ncbi:ETS domain-containing protein Elk-1 [Taenia crassiceps]|uniref:ETS domain-containing protein Elk-1 n=1 Tax=Taenia crassiceps TaxID=6207 RepID=A0ABR4QT52_9CEST
MSIAPMLIPPLVKPDLPSDYRETKCQQQQQQQQPQQQQQKQDCEMSADCSAFRPKSPRKSASEGFSTPPVPPSSGFLSAFKAPHSVPPSMGLGGVSADDLTCLQSGRTYYYGSPETPEVEDLEFDTTKGKVTLWQFLLQLLLDPRYCDIIRWTNNAGEFVLLRAEEVARLWGLRKDNNHRMNYDKLSRALRYYYQKNIIRKVQGHKFVYQFIGLHRLKGLIRMQNVEEGGVESIFPSELMKSQRRHSTSNKPIVGLSSESCFNGFSSFHKQAAPLFVDSFNNPETSKSPQVLSSSQDAPKLSPTHFQSTFPSNLGQSFNFGVPSTSSASFPFHPIQSSSSSNFTRLYPNLPKKSEKSHFPTSTAESVENVASLVCKDVFQALLPPNRPSKRSSSPNCHCSCHGSLAFSPKACENRTLHFNPNPPHPSTPSASLPVHRKPRSLDCWSPISGSQHEEPLPPPHTPDHRSFLHWQRHMINMNRLKEQIQRVSRCTEDGKPPLQSLSPHHQSQSIFRPFDVPRNDSGKPEEMDLEMKSNQKVTEDVSGVSASGTNGINNTNGSSNSSNGNGNYIWMPIQVDLVEHFMSMLSQTLQDRKCREPPLAHSSPHC